MKQSAHDLPDWVVFLSLPRRALLVSYCVLLGEILSNRQQNGANDGIYFPDISVGPFTSDSCSLSFG